VAFFNLTAPGRVTNQNAHPTLPLWRRRTNVKVMTGNFNADGLTRQTDIAARDIA